MSGASVPYSIQELGSLATMVDGSDAAPTEAMMTAYQDYCRDLASVATEWNALVKSDLPGVNEKIAEQHLTGLKAGELPVGSCK